MPKFYTCGYTGHKIDDLVAAVLTLDALLVDIRFSANSINPDYQGVNLIERFGERDYVHIRELGNKNYNTDAPIDIANYTVGKNRLVYLATPPSCALLMCACADPDHCHRTVVADTLRKDGFVVEEFDWKSIKPSKPAKPIQLSLF